MVQAAGTPVLMGERLGEGGQGVVHAAQIGGASCAVKWYRAVPKPKELRDSVAALIHNGCPHPAFIWPFDLVVSTTCTGTVTITRSSGWSKLIPPNPEK